MKLAILTDCYFPSTKSISFLIRDLAVEFHQKRGYEVTIITTDSTVKSPFVISMDNGVRTLRVRGPVTKGLWLPLRGLVEVLQPWILWWNARAWFQKNPQDCLVFYSPSAFWGPLVRRLKRLWKCRTYLILRDIFPEWLVQLELIKNPLAVAALKALTNDQYAVADTIGAQSQKDVHFLETKLSPTSTSIELLYNWRAAGDAVKTDPGFRARHGFRAEDTIFFFGGTFSASQSTADAMRLVETLGARSNRLKFYFMGAGSAFQTMRQHAQERKLGNVVFEASKPLEQYLRTLGSCDVGCLTLDARYKFDNIPGRALDYMLSKKPILAALNPRNEFIETINRNQAGIALPITDLSGVVEAAVKLAEDADLRKRMGENSGSLLQSLFSPSRAADQIETCFVGTHRTVRKLSSKP